MDKFTMTWLYETFWTDSFWLPKGYTWNDLKSTPQLKKAEFSDLMILPVLVILLSTFRYLFERSIAKPFCLFLGIPDEEIIVEHKSLEKMYKNGTLFPSDKELNILVNITGLSKQYICAWFRKRRTGRKTPLLKKATETCWRCFIYFLLFCYGSFVILKTDWFYDSSTWMKDFIRKHEFTTDLKWYYFAEITFYSSLFISQFFDAKRKDFYQLFVHHITTLVLLLGSYTLSLYRFGAIIMYLHDAADSWLEAAKLANYAKIQKACDALFAMFAIVFISTRIIYYPAWVAHAYFYYSTYEASIVLKFLVCLCFLLLFLHFYWGYLIIKMVYKLIRSGKVDKDTRSDTEDSGDNEA